VDQPAGAGSILIAGVLALGVELGDHHGLARFLAPQVEQLGVGCPDVIDVIDVHGDHVEVATRGTENAGAAQEGSVQPRTETQVIGIVLADGARGDLEIAVEDMLAEGFI